MPGFIRVEPAAEGEESMQEGGEWYEWDIIFSRYIIFQTSASPGLFLYWSLFTGREID